jgi:hypothetical protein
MARIRRTITGGFFFVNYCKVANIELISLQEVSVGL